MCCSTGKLVVPLSADVSCANVHDTQMYRGVIESLIDIQYVVADAGYDDHDLYDFTRQRGARLVCPIHRYQHTKEQKLELIKILQIKEGQVYKTRSISIEPLIQVSRTVWHIGYASVWI